MTGATMADGVRLLLGDAVERMKEIEDGSVDAIISDPPYAEVGRPYGRLTEAEWWSLMMGVCRESRRVLRPKGSAVFVLQPNSRKLGSMRGWLWRFMAWACDEWNMIQDAYWWNTAAIPEAHAIQGRLMRPSLKACVWLGPADCHRDQDAVSWEESQENARQRLMKRSENRVRHGGHRMNEATSRTASVLRGGVTPFNVLPVPGGRRQGQGSHPASTPMPLADWWVRFISPPGGVVLDMFAGSGTIPLAALARGRKAIGIERDKGYFATMSSRIAEAEASHPLFDARAS